MNKRTPVKSSRCENLTDVKAVLEEWMNYAVAYRQKAIFDSTKRFYNGKIKRLKTAILVVDREITRKRLDGGMEGGGDAG